MAQATMPVDVSRTTKLPPVVSLRSLVHEYREHLPIWFVYLSGIGLLHAALANFPQDGFAALCIERWRFAPTLLLPWTWFIAYFVLRIRSSSRLASPWKAYVGLFVLTALVPAVIVLGYQPYPLSHDQLTLVFEGSQYFWVALFVGQILLSRGWRSLVTYFGVTFVYGLVLENSGIIMRFFYEPSFRLYLGPLPAPLVTMLGWSLGLLRHGGGHRSPCRIRAVAETWHLASSVGGDAHGALHGRAARSTRLDVRSVLAMERAATTRFLGCASDQLRRLVWRLPALRLLRLQDSRTSGAE